MGIYFERKKSIRCVLPQWTKLHPKRYIWYFWYYILMFFSAYLHSSPRVVFSTWILDQSNNSFNYFGNEKIHNKQHKHACLVLYMEYTTIYDSIYRPNCNPEYYYYFFTVMQFEKRDSKPTLAFVGLWSQYINDVHKDQHVLTI